MNAEGRLVQQPVYDAIGEFKQFGYATMQRKGRVGLLNSEGVEIVPPNFDDLKPLDSTLISVMEKGQWKVINLEGRVILPAGYEQVEVLKSRNHVGFAFHMAFLSYKKDNKWGIINEQGKVLAEPRFDEVSLLKNLPEGITTTFFQTKINGLLGLFLPNGFELLPPQADEIRVWNATLIFYEKTQKWGAVNQLGQQVLENVYDHFSSLSDNFLKLVSNNKTYLFSLVYNKVITEGEFEAFYAFSDDFVLCKKKRLLGLLDHCGSLVLTNKYNEIQAYEGEIFRANLEGKWGIVTLDDQRLIPFEYDYISPMKKGRCVVVSNRKCGVANNRGKVMVAPQFDRIELEDDEIKAYAGQQLSVFNFGEEGQLDSRSNFDSHFTIKVTKGNRLRNIDQDAQSPYELEKFEWFYSPKHDKWGLRRLDNGTVQIEPTFHEVRVEKELGLTLVGIEMMPKINFDRTSYRFEMGYGLVQNDTGLLVHEVDLVDIRLSDFDSGLPVARCIFTNGKHGLVNKIGKIISKDYAFIGEFSDGVARASQKGKMSASLDKSVLNMGSLQKFLTAVLAPVTLTDYTQHDLNIDNKGKLTCESCTWSYMDTTGATVVQPQFSFAKDFVNQVGIVELEGKWGMVDNKGKQLLPCKYDELGFLENTGNKVLRVFKKEEKYGLIDTLGRLAVGVHYENIGSFSEGRLAAKRNNVWGFVDGNGREVVPCRFDEVGPFSDGLAAARLGSKWGYIDRHGSVELDFQYSKAGKFSNGLAPAKREGPHYGYIDITGTWAIKPNFPKAHPFVRGIAKVEEMTGQFLRTGLIDTLGNYILRPKYVSISDFNLHGLAVAEIEGSPAKYALITTKGQVITNLPYRSIEPFVEGMARVQYHDNWGFVDTTGKLVVQAVFFKASDFAEGKAAVWQNGQCGFIDRTGKYVVEPIFSKCMNFKDGKAIVFKGSQRAGLIDAAGNFIIEPGINKLIDFADGRGLVRGDNYQFYYITEQSRFYNGFYEKAGQYQHGVAVVQIDGNWAIINQQGIEIIPPKYDKIEQFEDGFAKVRIKGFNGLTNLQGELIVQPNYEYISYAGEGLFRVEQGDKVGYFDMGGKWVWGLQE
ncbi:MAG: WG repeat-containing protein [Saprospiraceae bacterium]|nr:WG repeat-containing protein [Saprospiraceae bacterium]MCF8248525.1 WG repeat-containing protein [Saprospiraceae bacterium]MCF8310259.1 WG repeat-containing protein [Saprospiraceae bacterium]MCF8439302.1 WG repeat-containing protein [Saprospiraceae bacterium]